MIQAILSNKAGRNFLSNQFYWKDLFSASEDSLTSTLFGTLLYLPRELFWRILRGAIYECGIEGLESEIVHIEFWPHWITSNSTNKIYIEPDLFIRTSNYDLIIEAKRYDFDQQNKFQWENQFKEYLNQYGYEKKAYLLAVGGITNESKEELVDGGYAIEVYKTRWHRILYEVKRIAHTYETKREFFDPTYLALKDIIEGFKLHGYITCEWFEDICLFENKNIHESSIKYLIDSPYKNHN